MHCLRERIQIWVKLTVTHGQTSGEISELPVFDLLERVQICHLVAKTSTHDARGQRKQNSRQKYNSYHGRFRSNEQQRADYRIK